MSTATASPNPVVSFFTGLVSDIKSFFGSAIGLEVTEFVASAAGCASGLAVIEEVNPSDKAGTATDIFTLCSAALSLLSGTSAPTLAQIQAAFTAFKSSSATSAYAGIATTFSAALSNYIAKYSGTGWIQVATWYIYGWQLAAQILGGAATASPASGLPTLALTAPTPAPVVPVAAPVASAPVAAPAASATPAGTAA